MAENNMDEVMVEKALKGLKASYDMYETTKKETNITMIHPQRKKRRTHSKA